MATNVIASIHPDGAEDYTTLALAEVGERRSLTAADEIANFQFVGDWSAAAETGGASFAPANWTVDSTRYVLIDTDAGNRAGVLWDDTKPRINSNISFRVSYSRIFGLQCTNAGTGAIITIGNGAGTEAYEGCLVDSCRLRGRDIRSTSTTGPNTFRNCTLTDSVAQVVRGGFQNTNATGVLHVEYCTVASAGSNFSGVNSTGLVVATNVAAYLAGAAADFTGSNYTGSDYNAASDTSAPGANSVDNITTAAFADFDGLDFRVAASGALDGAGTPISGVTVDLLGNPRDATSPCIGAFEIVSAGGDEIELTGAALGGGMASCACGPLTNALGAILSDGRANATGSPVALSEAYALGSGQSLVDGSPIVGGAAGALGGGYAEGEVEPLTTAATVAMAESRGGARPSSLMSLIVGAVSRLFGGGQEDASGAGLAATSGDTLGGGYVEGGDQLPTRNAEASVRGGGMLSATATAITGAFAGVRGGGRVSQALSSLTSAMLSLFGGGRTESQFGTVLPATPPTISSVRIAAGPTISNVRVAPGPTISNVRVIQ